MMRQIEATTLTDFSKICTREKEHRSTAFSVKLMLQVRRLLTQTAKKG